jgi:hypothetical protein
MTTFFVQKSEKVEELLSALEDFYPGQLTITDVLQIDTLADVCEVLDPLLEGLSKENKKTVSKARLKPKNNGKGATAICPICHKEFTIKRQGKYCSKPCMQKAYRMKKQEPEFQVVGTSRKLNSRELDLALKAGEFTTGTRFRNFKTGEDFYCELETHGDEISYKLLPAPVDL